MEVLPCTEGSADMWVSGPPSALWSGLCCLVSHEGFRERLCLQSLSCRWQSRADPLPRAQCRATVFITVVRAALHYFLSQRHLAPLTYLL